MGVRSVMRKTTRLGGLAGLVHRHGAYQASHLTHQRPSGSQIVVHATTDLDGAGLDASSMPIDGAVLLIERNDRVGIGEIGGQIRREGRLIAFDRQHTGPAVTDKSQLIVAPAVGSTLHVV